MFKLPIQYVCHSELDEYTIRELELIDSEETPIYERFFKPKTPEAKTMLHQWAKYYTTDKTFLEESTVLFKNSPSPIPINTFVDYWREIQSNKEFKIKYQYIESSLLNRLNMSSSFLMFISLYFITSPIVFMMSPIFMILLPFYLLRKKNIDFSWHTYTIFFKQILAGHPIGGLMNFKGADPKQRVYLIGSALFFCIQLYTNIYTFYTFYTNMDHIRQVFTSMNEYLKSTLQKIEVVQNIKLDSYRNFYHALEGNKQILHTFYQKTKKLNHSVSQYGVIRSLFYELYENKSLSSAIEYSFGFHGFLQNVRSLKRRNTCTFSDKTAFVKAYYPTPSPVKNTYSLKNMIITGPNASGKTTMLKTTFINVLLSQQVRCGFYKSATICPYDELKCYINIPDTSGRDSLFQAEARRCKEIVEEVVKNKRIFCIFDELFSGTNPQEASASVCSLLTFLVSYPTFCFFMTTHFLNVCDELKDQPIHMKKMSLLNGKYTYKLTNGISYDKGGVNVLEQLNFPDSIVKDARMRTK